MGRITQELAELSGLRTHIFDAESFESSLREAQRAGAPAAWICRKGSFSGGGVTPELKLHTTSRVVTPATQGDFEPSLKREEALAVIAPLLNRGLGGAEGAPALAVVCTTGKTSREFYELDDQDHSKRNRFYMVGSMGCASSLGFGVSVARPHHRVIVLDGDGAAIMRLGALTTLGAERPPNLVHIVLDNGQHESTGGQPTVTGPTDLAAVAAGCGYPRVERAASPDQLAAVLRDNGDGPVFVHVPISPGTQGALPRPEISPLEVASRFRAHLAARPVPI